jgi:hypothetical protein
MQNILLQQFLKLKSKVKSLLKQSPTLSRIMKRWLAGKLLLALASTVSSWVPGIFLGLKGGWRVRLTTHRHL